MKTKPKTIKFRKVELNITLRCNSACANCNRLCNIQPLEDDMTVEQVQLMVDKLKEANHPLIRVKVVGGEPTIHPQFREICEVLSQASRDGYAGKVSINTNAVIPPASLSPLPDLVRWRPSKVSKKGHLPVLWSPKDAGIETEGPCKMPRICGFSLDAHGWLPCSVAIPMVRLFDRMDLYKPLDGPLPLEVWGVEDLCPDCVFSMPVAWSRESGRKNIGRTPPLYKMPSPTWAKALWDYFRPMQELEELGSCEEGD